MTSVKEAILSKLLEAQELLELARCEDELFTESMENDYDCHADSWAMEISSAMDELTEKIEYYVEN